MPGTGSPAQEGRVLEGCSGGSDVELEQWRAVMAVGMALQLEQVCRQGAVRELECVGHGREPQPWLVPPALAQERQRNTSCGVQHSLCGHAPPWVAGGAPGQTKAQTI